MNAYEALKKHEHHELAISLHEHQSTEPGNDEYFEVAELYCLEPECIDKEETSVLEFNDRGELIHADA